MTGKRRATPEPSGGKRPKGPPLPPSAPPAQSPSGAINPIRSRREARQDRTQRRRKIGGLSTLGIVAIVVVIVLVAVYVGHQITSGGSKKAGRPQTTLLFQVVGPGGGSEGGILLAHDQTSSNAGVEVMIPTSLISPLCGFGQQSFGDILALPNGASESASAVSASLDNVIVDGTWQLSESQLAALVNAVGGVSVNVDVNVTEPGKAGTVKVLVPKGSAERLNGTQAAEFATYHAKSGETAASQLVRLQSVLQATIDKLPSTSSGVESIVNKLGSTASSSLGASRLSSLLVANAADDRKSGGVLAEVLPVDPLETGGPASYQVDVTKSDALARALFKDSLPKQSGAQTTIQVQSATGRPGSELDACRQLKAASFQVSSGGNLSFSKEKSEILVNSRSIAEAELGKRVAVALKLPDGDVEVNPLGQTVADVLVVLGSDYKP